MRGGEHVPGVHEQDPGVECGRVQPRDLPGVLHQVTMMIIMMIIIMMDHDDNDDNDDHLGCASCVSGTRAPSAGR